MRSHGRSKILGDLELEYNSMGEDVLYTCKKLNMSKVHLIGHSMGGKVAAAACLAEQSDIKVLSAILLDISPVKYSVDKEFKEVMYTVDFLETTTHRMSSKGLMRRAIAEAFSDEALRLFLESNLKEKEGKLQWSFSVPGISRSRQSLLDWTPRDDSSFDRPLLLLKGGKSSFIKTSHLDEIMRHFPLYNLRTIQGAGHWLHSRRPKRLL